MKTKSLFKKALFLTVLGVHYIVPYFYMNSTAIGHNII